MSELLELAERIEAYDPTQSPDNRADELELHRDIVLATGEGAMNPAFEATFVRSLDAAMTLVPDGWHVSHSGEGRFMTRGKFAATVETWGFVKADDGQRHSHDAEPPKWRGAAVARDSETDAQGGSHDL